MTFATPDPQWIIKPWGRMKTFVLNTPASVLVENGAFVVCAGGRCVPINGEGVDWGVQNIHWDSQDPCTVKILEVLPGQRLSDQRHRHRSEQWDVLTPGAMVDIEGEKEGARHIEPVVGDCIVIPVGSWHRLGCRNDAVGPVIILEISTGPFSEDDIERRSDDYGRK